MYRDGLVPRQENVPLTIDAQYVVGFDWARQAGLRVVKDFDDHKMWAGLSLEEPQTTFSSSAGPNCLTGARRRRRPVAARWNTPSAADPTSTRSRPTATTMRPTSSPRSRRIRAGATTSCTGCCASWAGVSPTPPPARARTTRPPARVSARGMILPLVPQDAGLPGQRPGRPGRRPLRLGSPPRRHVLPDRQDRTAVRIFDHGRVRRTSDPGGRHLRLWRRRGRGHQVLSPARSATATRT